MKFWDTSAIVPLLLEEENSQECRNLYRADPAVVVWQFTETEVVSAVMKASRSAPPLLEAEELDRAHARLDRLANRWEQVMVLTEGGLVEIRRRARRLMREHTIHSADSLQLAAALLRFDRPMRRDFVVTDGLLAAAADAEGFNVIRLKRTSRRRR